MNHRTIQRYLWIAVAVFAIWTYGEKGRYDHAYRLLFLDTKTGAVWAHGPRQARPPNRSDWLELEKDPEERPN